jgi:hypothetical protein
MGGGVRNTEDEEGGSEEEFQSPRKKMKRSPAPDPVETKQKAGSRSSSATPSSAGNSLSFEDLTAEEALRFLEKIHAKPPAWSSLGTKELDRTRHLLADISGHTYVAYQTISQKK